MPQLAQLVNNPWFKHFCALFDEQAKGSNNIVFGVATLETFLTREQCIGEVKAFGAFEATIKGAYDDLVQKLEDRKPKQPESDQNE